MNKRTTEMKCDLKNTFKKHHDDQINDQRDREARWQHDQGYSVLDAYDK